MSTSADADFKREIDVGLKAGEKSTSQMSTSVHDRTSHFLKQAEEILTSVFFNSTGYV